MTGQTVKTKPPEIASNPMARLAPYFVDAINNDRLESQTSFLDSALSDGARAEKPAGARAKILEKARNERGGSS